MDVNHENNLQLLSRLNLLNEQHRELKEYLKKLFADPTFYFTELVQFKVEEEIKEGIRTGKYGPKGIISEGLINTSNGR